MMPIFLGANIFLDVFSQRLLFYPDSAKVLTLVERQHINGYTSSLKFERTSFIFFGSSVRAMTSLH
jgi:hypothetical protein